MATKSTKKSTATTAKKRPAAKSTKSTKAAKKNEYQSFQLSQSKEPFMTFRITRQTLYWLILGVVVLLFSWYTLSVSQSIEDIYNQIDEIRLTEESIVLEPNTNEQ